MKKIVAVAIGVLALSNVALAQVGAGTKTITRNDQALKDSLAKVKYNHVFPFLGEKVVRRGFNLPKSAGVMVNAVIAKQEVTISDLQVGFNNGTMYGLDSIAKFGEVAGYVQNVNLRADVWVLPFLNVYGIFGQAWANTKVNLTAPVTASTEAKFSGYIYGFGLTAASGVQGFFLTLDFNSVWTHFDELNDNAHVMMLTPRIGHTFALKKKDSNIGVWVGGSKIYINRNTSGSIALGEVAPDLTGDKLNVILNTSDVNDWNTHHPDHQLSRAQYITMKNLAQDVYDKLPEINQGIDNTTVNYSLKKRPKSSFTGCFGVQYQLSPTWQFRTEIGLLGGRTSGLLSVNYRFNL